MLTIIKVEADKQEAPSAKKSAKKGGEGKTRRFGTNEQIQDAGLSRDPTVRTRPKPGKPGDGKPTGPTAVDGRVA